MDFTKVENFIRNNMFYEKWTCNICGVEVFNTAFCPDCASSLSVIKDNKCKHCGRIAYSPVEFCDSCKTQNLDFDRARSLYEYKAPVSTLIQNFKYENKRYLARVLAGEFFNLYKQEEFAPDIITFVPMHEERLKERGYNQAELLAKELSVIVRVEVKEVVSKIKETERQANLTFEERIKNLQGSFKVSKEEVKDKKILLIDDVLTTGSTVNAISKLLKQAGAKSVYVLTIASVQKQ